MKIKRKIDNAVAGQLRKIISSFDKEDMKPIFVLWFWFIFLNRPIYLAVKQAIKFWLG